MLLFVVDCPTGVDGRHLRHFIIPCLGFLFLPFTTLMYVFLKQGVGTIQGLDWLWLFLAVILDLASIAGAGAANRNRIPAGYPGSYPPEPPAPQA